jgi:predicted PurR-regulated permease PerM
MNRENLSTGRPDSFKKPAAEKLLSPKSGASPVVIFAAFIIALWGLVAAKSFLIPIFAATLLALLMMPLVRFLRSRKLPEWVAVMTAALVLVLPLLLVASLVVRESASLIQDWPKLEGEARTSFASLLLYLKSPWLAKLHLDSSLDISSVAQRIGNSASAGITIAFAALGTVFSLGSDLVLVLFFAVMMIASREHLKTSFERILERYDSEKSASVLDAMTEVLESFLVARLIMILFVAVADFIILESFGVSYAVILSVFLGLMTLIPAVGFVFGLIPPVIVAVAQGKPLWEILALVAGIWIVSSLQDHLLTPKLIGRRLNLNFLITYLAIFAGERLWGIWGMFLSVPVLGVVRILLNSSENLRPFGQLIQEHEDVEEAAAVDAKKQNATQPNRSVPEPALLNH